MRKNKICFRLKNFRRAAAFYRGTLSLLLLAAVAGCATQPPAAPLRSVRSLSAPTPVISANPSSFYNSSAVPHDVTHIVGPYETLWRISKTYGVDLDTLMRANRLNSPNQLKEGQRLVIPSTRGPRPYIPLPNASRWTYIVIHHTATHDGNASSINKMHHQRGFWNGLGYHFLIDNGTDTKGEGQIEIGPRWMKQLDGAHANADDMNIRGIGISLIGNFSETRVPSKQVDSLVYLVMLLMERYRIPYDHVIRHSDVKGKNTECPGLNFPWAEFKRRIASR